jgi:hypothetical protein
MEGVEQDNLFSEVIQKTQKLNLGRLSHGTIVLPHSVLIRFWSFAAKTFHVPDSTFFQEL